MAGAHIVLDLSRLLWRSDRFAPTGIDRVELAYARHLIATARDRLSFAGWWGRLGPLPTGDAIALVESLDTLWAGDALDRSARDRAAGMARKLRWHALRRGERALHALADARGGCITYLNVSHYRLHRPAALARLKERTGARLVCLVHDLIPIECPEHVERGDPERHRQRIATVAQLADAVIVNSRGTQAALKRHLGGASWDAHVLIAPLGIDLRPPPHRATAPPRPYFVCLATIEPRKNHSLLFRAWSRLAAELGERTPRLILIGRRGWQGRDILNGFQGSAVPEALIETHEGLSDGAVAGLVAGAQGLLYPSFAEGYGLPVAEALALGVPVLCSDLPELREVGKAVPEYLDPRDAPAWADAVRSYASNGSVRRQAQLARLASWQPPSWDAHFALVEPLLHDRVPAPHAIAARVRRKAG